MRPRQVLLAAGLVASLLGGTLEAAVAQDGAAPSSGAGATVAPGFKPPARPADVPPEDWPFWPNGAVKRGGNLDISTPTMHVLRHGSHVEITTPTLTYVQHGADVTISTPTMTMSRHGSDIVISTPTGTVHRQAATADRDDDDDDAGDGASTHHDSSSSSSSSSGGGGVVGVLAVAACAYVARRAWLRRRRRPFDAMSRPAYPPRPAGFDPRARGSSAPGDGAAEAVLEQLLRLERRLAMIETAVTSAEFELQRGFSALEPGGRHL